ncbi:unnamed protein product [Rhizoctonia solani]|uniref:Uncharacterized protein n=1 Tax=Rhizoctonia solani TaxID=456999 RepID=A0A8H3AQF1_9AGAM|nr:unnamed protein product [Rhizoctonia solani]
MDKVFRIPELVRGICENGEPADNAHLALTSQNLFAQVIPVVWAHVSGVSQLLRLIDGTTYRKPNKFQLGEVILPNDLDLEMITHSRFGFYAPFVTSLNIYNTGSGGLLVPQLELLAKLTFAHAPLPNLIRLKISRDWTSRKHEVLWVDIFSCSMYMLEDHLLLAMGSLPEVRHLEICFLTGKAQTFDVGHPILAPHSFPKLDRLVLFHIDESNAQSLWNIPALVTRLRSASIGFRRPVGDQDYGICRSFIPLVCAHSPQIHNLALDFNSEGDFLGESPHIAQFTEDAFSAITSLSLTQLEVRHACVSISPGPLVTSWPHLEVFRWPHQRVELSDLSLFAKHLPKLKHLALDINIQPSFGGLCPQVQSTKVSRHQLRTLESHFARLGELNDEAASQLYRYLRTLVPYAKLKLPHLFYTVLTDDQKLDENCVIAINHMERFVQKYNLSKNTDTQKSVCAVWNMVHQESKNS